MGMGRSRSYNPRTGKWTRPRKWYDHSRGRRKNDGCYIATAVYGTYDCPELWTLRRYRDYHLAKSLLGRCFIKFYYFTSPTFVHLFGTKKWFNNIFRNKLDKIVKRLNDEGYSSEEYQDRGW